MENSKKFRILELPYVAFREVLSKMAPLEKVNFSLISSKTNGITKSVTKSQTTKHKLVFMIGSDLRVLIDKRRCSYGYRMTCDKSKSELFTTDYSSSKICLKYSDDSLNGFMKWSEYVMQVLNCKIRSVNFYVDEVPYQIIPIINWLKTLTSTFLECHLIGKKESDDVLHHILNNFEITDFMYIHVPTKENFTAKLPKPLNWLFIRPSKWVTLQQILEVDCEEIDIRCSSLSNQELTNFVTSWMAMKSNLNLHRFETEIEKESDLAEIVKGLPEERLFFGAHEALEKQFRLRQMDASWTVTRDDGKRAVLFESVLNGKVYLYFVTIYNI